MWHFFRQLFETADFPVRWSCGTGWTDFLGWLHICSDLATALAYVSIPAALLWSRHRLRGLPVPILALTALFAGFIFSCGSVHLIEAGMFVWPAYRLSGLLKAITAVFSVATAIACVHWMPRIVSSPWLAQANRRLREEVRRRRDSERRALDANDRLAEIAFRDPLTGRKNRRGLQRALRRERARSERTGSPLGVIFLDLDDFKGINDSYGHDRGDEVLVEIARRVRTCVREIDVIGRVGGDEFLLLLPDSDPEGARTSAERVRRAVAEGAATTATTGAPIRVTASLAVSAVHEGDDDISLLLRATADLLKFAKTEGKNRVVGSSSGGSVLLPSVLHVALDWRRQLVVDLASHRLQAVEWRVRAAGPVTRAREALFRRAEEQGVATAFDLRCLREGVRRADELGGSPARLPQSLDVGPRTLQEAPDEVLEILDARFGRTLCLDLRASHLFDVPARLLTARADLRRAGIEVALDGAGFDRGTLEALLVLAPDVVKIDREVVRRCSRDHERREKLRRLLRGADAVGCRVVARGIDGTDDLETVRAMGVRYGQGAFWPTCDPRIRSAKGSRRHSGATLLAQKRNVS